MFPTLFDSAWIGLDGALQFRIPAYFAAIMFGWALASALAWRDVRKWGIERQVWVDFVIGMLIVGVFGARLMHVLVDGFLFDYINLCIDPFLIEGHALSSGAPCVSNLTCLAEQERGFDIGGICRPEDGLCYPQQDCFRWLKFWAGGLTIYGAVIATVITGWWYTRRHGLPAAKIIDIGGYGIPLGIAFGRLGCFASGCCFGDVCDIEWLSVQFPQGSSPYHHHFEAHYEELSAQWRTGVHRSLPVWPTQLISSAYNFVIFGVVYFLVRPKKKFDGQLILSFVCLYAIARFGIEFVRADQRGGIGVVSTSQIVAIITLAGAIGLFARLRRRAPEPDAED